MCRTWSTRNYEPRFIPIYEVFGIQIVAASTWGAQRIEELLCDVSLRTVFSAGNGEVEVYEIIVPAAWHGRRLGEIVNHSGCLPIALTRAGKAVLPTADTARRGVRHFAPERDIRRHRSAAPPACGIEGGLRCS